MDSQPLISGIGARMGVELIVMLNEVSAVHLKSALIISSLKMKIV